MLRRRLRVPAKVTTHPQQQQTETTGGVHPPQRRSSCLSWSGGGHPPPAQQQHWRWPAGGVHPPRRRSSRGGGEPPPQWPKDMSRASSRLSSMQEKMAFFAESDTDYPRGVRPFASQASNVFLDSEWSLSKSENFNLPIVHPCRIYQKGRWCIDASCLVQNLGKHGTGSSYRRNGRPYTEVLYSTFL